MTVDDFEPGPHLVSSAAPPDEGTVRFDPEWRTSTVLALANVIARDGTFDVLPILADALEDAGCNNQLMLRHCRHAPNHLTACWVLPLILDSASTVIATSRANEPSLLMEAGRIFGALDDGKTGRLFSARGQESLLWFWSIVVGAICAITTGSYVKPTAVAVFGSLFGIPAVVYLGVGGVVVFRRWRRRHISRRAFTAGEDQSR